MKVFDTSRPAIDWLSRLGISYEIRIRITLGFMFLLIVTANLNSIRYFNQSKAVQLEALKYQTFRSLDQLAGYLKDNPNDKILSSYWRDLVRATGLTNVTVIETELLTEDETAASRFVDRTLIPEIRANYSRNKVTAGGISGALPASITDPHNEGVGGNVRTAFYHFIGSDGTPLTLVATVGNETESELAQFAVLNAWFQILSIAVAVVIAVALLKITFQPYQQIKSEAIAASIAKTDQPESVDFAVETFQHMIAELRRKEEHLQRLLGQQKERATTLERYNDYILSCMPSGVIGCDMKGVVTYFNTVAGRIFDRDDDSIVGENYQKALSDLPQIVQLLELSLLHSRETSIPEFEYTAANSKTLWLSLNCVLLKNENESPQGAMILISDLTDLKRLEAEISVKEQMAALGELSAGLAHQLRNSLAAMMGFTQLLQKLSAMEGQVPEIISQILMEGKATGEMLNRFLYLSRPGGFAMREVLWSEIRGNVENHFAGKLKEIEIGLEFEESDNLPEIVCDPMLISNALINLIQNGIEASPKNGRVRVNMGFVKESEVFRIEISDRGKGIPAAEIEKIFAPFYTNGKAEGTGLGLSLVRKWILAHGGEISCTSTPGKGTKFTIVLPQTPDITAKDHSSRKIALANS